MQVFGRIPLALSARCYHARAHRRTKDGCLFVCENDQDGLELTTLDRKPFLVINGIQTMSHSYLNLIGEVPQLREMGVLRFRLSPHTCDMVKVAEIFRGVTDGSIGIDEAAAGLNALKLSALANGFTTADRGTLGRTPRRLNCSSPAFSERPAIFVTLATVGYGRG